MSQYGPELFAAGEIRGTHGLRGDLRVTPLSGSGSALFGASRVLLAGKGGAPTEYQVARAMPHRGQLLMRLCGLESIAAVEGLVGCTVLMRFADLPPLGDDEFYWFELQGMTVVDRQRGEIGRIEELLPSPAHDVYVVRGVRGEVLIPAVEGVVLEVERASRRMTVDLPEGLLPDADDL